MRLFPGSAAATAADGLPTPRRYWAMLAIAIGITMAVLDGAVANLALPTIARELGVSAAQSVWVVSAYQLASVAVLLPLAALGERVGYRVVYLAGLGVFIVGSLACALASSLSWLVAARVLQALGAAGLMAVNGALVRHTYPLATLGRGVGLNALVVSAAAALGPTLASAVLAVASWRWLFAINVPFGLVNLLLAARALPVSAVTGERFDVVAAILNALTCCAVILGADTVGRTGEVGLGTAELAAGLVAAVLLYRRSCRFRLPLVPLDLLRDRTFALSAATSICAFTAYMLAFLAVPFLLEGALHRSVAVTGLLMTPWPVALGIAAPVAGRLADRLPAALMGTSGLLVLAAGLAALTLLDPAATSFAIGTRMAICGLGFAFFQAPNNRTLLAAAPRSRAGAAGGVLAVARLLGMSVGATMAGIVFHIAADTAERTDLIIATIFAIVGAGLSISRQRALR